MASATVGTGTGAGAGAGSNADLSGQSEVSKTATVRFRTAQPSHTSANFFACQAIDTLTDIFNSYSHPGGVSGGRRRVGRDGDDEDDDDWAGGGGQGGWRGRAGASGSGSHSTGAGSPSRAAHYKEIARVHDLWVKAKQELQDRNREVTKLRSQLARERTASEQRDRRVAELEDLSTVAVEIKDKLRFAV